MHKILDIQIPQTGRASGILNSSAIIKLISPNGVFLNIDNLSKNLIKYLFLKKKNLPGVNVDVSMKEEPSNQMSFESIQNGDSSSMSVDSVKADDSANSKERQNGGKEKKKRKENQDDGVKSPKKELED